MNKSVIDHICALRPSRAVGGPGAPLPSPRRPVDASAQLVQLRPRPLCRGPRRRWRLREPVRQERHDGSLKRVGREGGRCNVALVRVPKALRLGEPRRRSSLEPQQRPRVSDGVGNPRPVAPRFPLRNREGSSEGRERQAGRARAAGQGDVPCVLLLQLCSISGEGPDGNSRGEGEHPVRASSRTIAAPRIDGGDDVVASRLAKERVVVQRPGRAQHDESEGVPAARPAIGRLGKVAGVT